MSVESNQGEHIKYPSIGDMIGALGLPKSKANYGDIAAHIGYTKQPIACDELSDAIEAYLEKNAGPKYHSLGDMAMALGLPLVDVSTEKVAAHIGYDKKPIMFSELSDAVEAFLAE